MLIQLKLMVVMMLIFGILTDNDTKTVDYIWGNKDYKELVNVRKRDDADSEHEEIIIRSLKQPSCTKGFDIDGSKISYTIEKELGIELVGDTKVKIQIDEDHGKI